jgi:hypothetical protein
MEMRLFQRNIAMTQPVLWISLTPEKATPRKQDLWGCSVVAITLMMSLVVIVERSDMRTVVHHPQHPFLVIAC